VPFFEAANTIRSDNDVNEFLKGLIERTPDKSVLLEIIHSASASLPTTTKAELLVAVAKVSDEADVRSAVQQACGKISSDGDYRKVASALFNEENTKRN